MKYNFILNYDNDCQLNCMDMLDKRELLHKLLSELKFNDVEKIIGLNIYDYQIYDKTENIINVILSFSNEKKSIINQMEILWKN